MKLFLGEIVLNILRCSATVKYHGFGTMAFQKTESKVLKRRSKLLFSKTVVLQKKCAQAVKYYGFGIPS
jgi:hypothetical protein